MSRELSMNLFSRNSISVVRFGCRIESSEKTVSFSINNLRKKLAAAHGDALRKISYLRGSITVILRVGGGSEIFPPVIEWVPIPVIDEAWSLFPGHNFPDNSADRKVGAVNRDENMSLFIISRRATRVFRVPNPLEMNVPEVLDRPFSPGERASLGVIVQARAKILSIRRWFDKHHPDLKNHNCAYILARYTEDGGA